jgi:hypothetical protein
MRILYALAGAFILVIVDLLVNLLAAAIQQQTFGDRFSAQSTAWLAGLVVTGVVLGYWLGGKVELPAPAASQAPPQPSSSPKSPETISITRLRALLSYSELKGRGVHLSDILLIGSVLKIDSE